MITRPLPMNGPIVPSRRGATLVEVLMALLVMAIGVTSIFTLFPLSIVRSIRASQLTNAKIVEKNAEEIIRTSPQIITGAPQWQPFTRYGTSPNYLEFGGNPSDRWASPKPLAGNVLPNTNLIYRMDVPPPFNASSQVSTQFEPVWEQQFFFGRERTNSEGGYVNSDEFNDGVPPAAMPNPALQLTDGNIVWTACTLSPYPPDPTQSVYLVDPLGWWEYNDQGLTFARDRFGDINDTRNETLDRIHCQLTRAQAQGLFQSTDSRTALLDAEVPVSIDLVSPLAPRVIFDSTRDLVTTRQAGGELVFLSEDGRRSYTLPIDVLNSSGLPVNEVAIDPTFGSLPADFDTVSLGEVGQVRIDSTQSRYSWMMTVRRERDGDTHIQGVVFFNRGYNPLDEEAVIAEFHGPAIGGFRPDQVQLTWNVDPLPTARAGGDLVLKAGGYIFDAENGHWYQIRAVDSYDKSTPTRTALLTLTTDVVIQTDTIGPEPDYDGQAIVMPNIVHVFEPEAPQ